MLAEERFLAIVQYVDAHRAVTVQELTELFHTSESTIRRDLTELHERAFELGLATGSASAFEYWLAAKEDVVKLLTKDQKIYGL